MRKITKKSVAAFINDKRLVKANMCVNRGKMLLYGNEIARKHLDRFIVFGSAGWQTATTKERLNGLLSQFGARVYQRNFEWGVVSQFTGENYLVDCAFGAVNIIDTKTGKVYSDAVVSHQVIIGEILAGNPLAS